MGSNGEILLITMPMGVTHTNLLIRLPVRRVASTIKAIICLPLASAG